MHAHMQSEADALYSSAKWDRVGRVEESEQQGDGGRSSQAKRMPLAPACRSNGAVAECRNAAQ